MEFPTVNWSDTAAAGDWLVASVTSFGVDVNSLVPPGFAAYARLPHADRDQVGSLSRAEVSALAAALAPHGRGLIWYAIWEGFGWMHGGASTAVLISSTDPDVHAETRIAAWRAASQGFLASIPPARLHLPDRDYALYRGSIADAAAGFPTGQSPNLWWPADHSWCVATEIDLRSTYIAGSTAVINAVLPLGADRVAGSDPIGLRAGD